MEMLPTHSEQEEHSKKKELMQGTVGMMMQENSNLNKDKQEMSVVVLTDDSMFNNKMSEKEENKMNAMIDHMLSDLMHSDMMGSFNKEMMPSMMNGHRSDLVHGFNHPMMEKLLTKNPMFLEEEELPHSSNGQTTLGNFATEEGNAPLRYTDNSSHREASITDSDDTEATINNSFQPELQFTTLEVALGPAILPLQVTFNSTSTIPVASLTN